MFTAFSSELEKIALNRMEREIAAGNIQRTQVTPRTLDSTTGVRAVLGKKVTRSQLAAPASVSAETLARRREISQKTFEAGLKQPHINQTMLPGVGVGMAGSVAHVPPNTGAMIRTANSPLFGATRYLAGSFHPSVADAVATRARPVDKTLNSAFLGHENSERRLATASTSSSMVTPVASHLGSGPIFAEQMAARGDPEALAHISKARGHPDDRLLMKRYREAGGLPGRPLPLSGKAERSIDKGLSRDVRKLSPFARQQAVKIHATGGRVSYIPKDMPNLPQLGLNAAQGLQAARTGGNLSKVVEPGKKLLGGIRRSMKFVRTGV
jgi:hypothetical protein